MRNSLLAGLVAATISTAVASSGVIAQQSSTIKTNSGPTTQALTVHLALRGAAAGLVLRLPAHMEQRVVNPQGRPTRR